MQKHSIKNFDELATTPNRKIALEIMEAGLDAINTERVVLSSVSIVGNILFVRGKPFNLTEYKKIKVVGLFTHFANAKNPAFPKDTKKQTELFCKYIFKIHDENIIALAD